MTLLEKYPHLKTLIEKRENPVQSTNEESANNVNGSSISHGIDPSMKDIRKDTKKIAMKEAMKDARKDARKDTKKIPGGPQPPPPPRVSAEQLAAEGLEADDADWVTFDIEETGWRSRQEGELRAWLEQNKPSKVLRSDGVGWIAVTSWSVSVSD